MIGKRLNIDGKAAVCSLCAAVFIFDACSKEIVSRTGASGNVTTALVLDTGHFLTKTADPSEALISDVNVFIYDAWGLEEEHLWGKLNADGEFLLKIALGKRHSIYVFANAGYRMPDCGQDELKQLKYFMNKPDSYGHGIPMAGMLEDFDLPLDGKLEVKMERLMSKLSLRIDRSALREDVDFNVSSIRIGNCPRSVRPFAAGAVKGKDDLFPTGFFKGGDECADLNWRNNDGLSDNVAAYLLENPAKSLDPATSPYIELEIDYLSDHWYSSDKPLIYRFYIREKDSYCIERNCHYKVSVKPMEDGLLCEDSWRVDKSGLSAWDGDYHMKILPSGTVVDGTFYPFYYEMSLDGSLHFELDLFPKDMKVRFREDLVEDEKNEGRAEYIMDEDGKGFTVKAMGRSCMSTMILIPSSPLSEDDSETIVVVVK